MALSGSSPLLQLGQRSCGSLLPQTHHPRCLRTRLNQYPSTAARRPSRALSCRSARPLGRSALDAVCLASSANGASGGGRRSGAGGAGPAAAASSSSGASSEAGGRTTAVGAGSAAGGREELSWSAATLVENRAESADGSLRTLVLSVEDHVTYVEGRKVSRHQADPRWLDRYSVPGQQVAVRVPDQATSGNGAADGTGAPAGHHARYAIASSPYAARRESALLDASIVELLVDRCGRAEDQHLAGLAPGAMLEVSQPLGRGFVSLFSASEDTGLQAALEDSAALLLVGLGAAGIAPLRSTLEWVPVQAHATAHPVRLVYVAEGAAAAAYVKDWDQWREAGVGVTTCYVPGSNAVLASANGGEAGAAGLEGIQEALAAELFLGPGGLAALLGAPPGGASVLLAGLPGRLAAALSRQLAAAGVQRERILFCD